ncbi:benzoate 4-monooxygenase cytochrome p450 [Phlyctema vagabunda]|uniref:Benzoate 4-monooxygenase cytochrome p450 n=1 Tax=Phlyctema vagabunda TaxID=108571 RepID=A0ABR4PTZ7_9HELO
MAASTSSIVVVFTFIVLLFIRQIVQYLTSPLKDVPGPFLAKFTNLWRLYNTYGGRPELRHRLLHEQYGPVIRLGPNCVSLADPKLIKTIYDTRGEFLKTDFYSVNDVKAGNVILQNIFGTRSNTYHTSQERLMHKHYTLASLKEFEPSVDATVLQFQKRLDKEFVETGNTCKIDHWVSFFAWDVIGQVTFSKTMGFLDSGQDVNDMIRTAEMALDYFATIGQMPWLDKFLDKNPIMRIGPPSFGAAASFCASQVIDRLSGTDKHDPEKQKDFLDYFIELKRQNPNVVDDNQIVSFLLINILAGADTIAIILRAIIYFVVRNPRVHKRVLQELKVAGITMPTSYDEAIKLPYLTAVISESMRMHPGVGLLLERLVPETGLALSDGRVLKRGTIVGMNAWVVHTNKEIFGQDAASFVPERWLRSDAESEEEYRLRVSSMRSADLTFGAGKRRCIGKHVALLEIYKVIPMLFLKYDMEFVDPTGDWKVQNSWFVRQTGMDIKLSVLS